MGGVFLWTVPRPVFEATGAALFLMSSPILLR